MLDVFYYDYQDRIAAENAQQVVSADWASLDAGGPGDPARHPDPSDGRDDRSARTQVQLQQINVVGSVITDGIDFGLMFKINGETFGGSMDDFGEFRFGGSGTYTIDFKIPVSPDRQAKPTDDAADVERRPARLRAATSRRRSCQVAGKRNETNFVEAIPQLKVNFPVPVRVQRALDSASSATTSAASRTTSRSTRTARSTSIPPWFTLDLQYGYTLEDVIGDELTVRIGVYNADRSADPPVINGLDDALRSGHARCARPNVLRQADRGVLRMTMAKNAHTKETAMTARLHDRDRLRARARRRLRNPGYVDRPTRRPMAVAKVDRPSNAARDGDGHDRRSRARR